MNKIWILFLVLVVVVAGSWYFLNSKDSSTWDNSEETWDKATSTWDGSSEPINGETTPVTQGDSSAGTSVDVSAITSVGVVKEFTVVGNSFSFAPSKITVKKGDTVRITFQNKEGFHDWVIDEFNARTKQIRAGATETIEFVADKSGTFEYYCSVGTHRAMGMKGTLVVE